MFNRRPLAVVMVAVFGFVTNMAFASRVGMHLVDMTPRWTIEKMEHNPFDEKVSTDPEATYECVLSSKEESGTFQSGMKYSDVKQLVAYFGVPTPNELKGETFKAPRNHPFMKLDYFVTVQKHGGKYTPPSDEELHEKSAIAFSKMKQPDFSEIDRLTVFRAFRKVFEEDSDRKDFIQKLKNRVSELSDGKVQIIRDEESDLSKFLRLEDCFVLTNGSQRLRFTIDRYPSHKRPFRFY